MKNVIKNIALISLLFLSFVACSQRLEFEKTDEGAWIKEGENKVLFYQAKTKSLDGQYPRANYIHPLYGIDGFELTEDFPEDHLHHRGIFWTWHQVIIGDQRIGDAWACEDFVWDVQEVERKEAGKKALGIQTKTFWKSPLWKNEAGDQLPFLEENTTIIVHTKKENYRVIDFEISLLALEPELKIAGSDDHKGYGGFSVRMKMPEDIKFTSEEGEVEPKTEQVSAGSWMDVSGTLASDGGTGGVIMMCHPENPMYPEKWILRKKGSMQNPVFPGQLPAAISTSTPSILKYRLVIYEGALHKKTIENIFKSQ